MKFSLDDSGNNFVFSNYGNGKLEIAERRFQCNLLCFPDRIIEHWGTAVDKLHISHFNTLVEKRPDIVILGTGATQQFPSIELRRELAEIGLQLDVMDSGAACRTYNLLVSEGRDVAAAVICY